ncbi:hypothetical protein D1871_06230 [Nakamurella silvestris]|nr:hypothetical protein D1871_06230 [Nakamurella silvestris]
MFRSAGPVKAALGALTLAVVLPLGGTAWASAAPAVTAVPSSSGVLQEFPPTTPNSGLPFGIAWGDNLSGEAGNNDTDPLAEAVLVNGGSGLTGKEISTVDTGTGGSTCGIADGIGYCWGNNDSGQLGNDNAPTGSHVAVPVKGALTGKRISAISVGRDHACGILVGKAYCWGDNSKGQLGNNNAPNDSAVPVAVRQDAGILAGKTVTAISAGDEHTCAIADAKAYCWGNDGGGRLGNNTEGQFNKPVAVTAADGVLGGKVVTSISAAEAHTCALADGAAYCWGTNTSDQLGINSGVPKKLVPTAVSGLAGKTVTSVSAGGLNGCVLATTANDSTRRAYCWGFNGNRAVGDGTSADRPAAVAVKAEVGVLAGKSLSSVSVGRHGGCAVAVGKAYCWGDNNQGRLGINSQNFATLQAVPVAVVRPANVLDSRRFLTINVSEKSSAGVAVKTPHFSDVPTGYPFFDDIGWLSGSGIAQGFDDGSYQPTNDIDRQAMAAFLFRFLNPGVKVPACKGTTRLFTDVHTPDLFCGAIEWLVTAKITSVPPNKLFGPTGPITRKVMAGFLFRAQHPGVADQKCTGGVNDRLFGDVGADNSQCGNIEWLAKVGVTVGFDGGTFHPDEAVHRDSMAAFMHRAAELNSH